MQLQTARLCLDCEEIHESQQCPACSSHAFGYVSRWVPLALPPARRIAPPETREHQAYRRLLAPPRSRTVAWGLLAHGAIGVTVLSAARWLLQKNASVGTASAVP